MRLASVIYNCFESDDRSLDWEGQFHFLDREVLLLADDATETFISWEQAVSTEGDVIFGIAQQSASFFVNAPPVVREMSAHRFWRSLIGSRVRLHFVDAEHQTLAIQSSDGTVYCSAYESGYWGVDVVHISLQIPRAVA